MGLFDDLVRRSLGDLSAEVKRRLIRDLEGIGKAFVSTSVADAVSRTVIKSLDGVVAVAVKALPQEESERLAAAYLAEVTEQLDEFSQALLDYLPHAVSVEVAKKSHGNNSYQAVLARLERQRFIEGVRSEVKDVFRAVAGQEPTD